MLTLTFRGAAPNTHVLSFSQFALRKHKGQAGRPAETILPESLDAAMAHLLSKGTSSLTRGPSDDGAHADTAGGALPPSTGGARSRSHRLGSLSDVRVTGQEQKQTRARHALPTQKSLVLPLDPTRSARKNEAPPPLAQPGWRPTAATLIPTSIPTSIPTLS